MPSCDDCEQWVYDLKTGRRVGNYGVELRRPAGSKPPCHDCPKIRHGEPPTPATGRAAELSVRNRLALEHYEECKAVGAWPDDDRVRRNAAIIRRIEDAVAAGREDRVVTAMLMANTVNTAPRKDRRR